MIRSLVFFFGAVAALLLSLGHDVDAEPTRSLDLSANHVYFYGNRYVVTGEGNVRVRFSDGTVVSGDQFTMDLKLNRFLIAGDVHIDSRTAHFTGAGFAGYPDFDLTYFIPEGTAPDRWTFKGTDFEHPIKGRQQPGDAFFFSDITGDKPYIKASHAQIIPKTNVKFIGSSIYVLDAYIPTNSFVVNFSSNPNFNQNGFAGATADVGIPFNASEHSISTLHLRYDPTTKLYYSFDQHFVWNRDWVVFSVNPIDRYQKQYNLIGFKQISQAMQFKVFYQLSTIGHTLLGQQEGVADYLNLQYNTVFRRTGIAVNGDFYNSSILANNEFVQQDLHPNDFQISFTGFDDKVGKLPLTYQTQAGFYQTHESDICGFGASCNAPAPPPPGLYLLNFDNNAITTESFYYLGIKVHTDPIKLPENITFVAVYNTQHTQFSLPHHIDSTTTTASLSRQFGTKIATSLAYSVAQTGDYYNGRFQSIVYPSVAIPGDPGYSAFDGFETLRTLLATAVFTPTPDFTFRLQLQKEDDFPQAVPAFFGTPPYTISADVRFRLTRQILVDVQRSYYFNYASTEKWSPGFLVQIGP